jgi:GTP-binding protein
LAKLKRFCKKQNLELFPISAVTGKGIEELKYAMANKVEEIGRQASVDRLEENPAHTETETEEIVPQKRKSL